MQRLALTLELYNLRAQRLFGFRLLMLFVIHIQIRLGSGGLAAGDSPGRFGCCLWGSLGVVLGVFFSMRSDVRRLKEGSVSRHALNLSNGDLFL